ncbi:hypothetical protein HK103_007502 [Boothiomyces macroporosus]|uniref:Uncharacterized protein n=1 Tax=Boothiomyces macroporosus TaxID=261099 RepID=A0AAD5Y3Y3_9FUNG|nr:hypothetical protein HK103_007502 [Boothiomyces macroporosus]
MLKKAKAPAVSTDKDKPKPKAKSVKQRKKKEQPAIIAEKETVSETPPVAQLDENPKEGVTIDVAVEDVAVEDVAVEAVLGRIHVRFNHYNQPFPIKDGILDGNLVDDKYAFSFVHKGNFQLILRNEQSEEMKQPSRFIYSGLEDGKSYTIEVIPDPEIETKRHYGTGIKFNSVKKPNNQVDLITKELKAMTMDQLMEKGDRYKELLEARELESCLYS